MKKIATLTILVLFSVFTAAFTSNAITKGSNSSTKEIVQSDSLSSESNKETSKKDTSFLNYIKLIGLNKTELMEKLGEEPTTIDEGGLKFSQLDIRVWFKDYGKGPVEQVYIDNKDVDFDGLRLGDKICSFKEKFGKPVEEHLSFAISNFKYKGIVLSVYYDPKTETTFAVYILDENVK
ncbi:hypothetical protein K9O30_00655 [Clostridium bowmanii]|uniref:hypothetical protein n=1 Tax=Clostridium bowmanii TaxID=132925 RepID=UPI001C0D9686|nr:hypothetical protein [Clostridium bowmanii]MBU3188095.1 hypothetical protein [Clostridium bowmanii]MCA1072276.1 hypothetical protein [Clostridium bowmanii]